MWPFKKPTALNPLILRRKHNGGQSCGSLMVRPCGNDVEVMSMHLRGHAVAPHLGDSPLRMAHIHKDLVSDAAAEARSIHLHAPGVTSYDDNNREVSNDRYYDGIIPLAVESPTASVVKTLQMRDAHQREQQASAWILRHRRQGTRLSEDESQLLYNVLLSQDKDPESFQLLWELAEFAAPNAALQDLAHLTVEYPQAMARNSALAYLHYVEQIDISRYAADDDLNVRDCVARTLLDIRRDEAVRIWTSIMDSPQVPLDLAETVPWTLLKLGVPVGSGPHPDLWRRGRAT